MPTQNVSVGVFCAKDYTNQARIIATLDAYHLRHQIGEVALPSRFGPHSAAYVWAKLRQIPVYELPYVYLEPEESRLSAFLEKCEPFFGLTFGAPKLDAEASWLGTTLCQFA